MGWTYELSRYLLEYFYLFFIFDNLANTKVTNDWLFIKYISFTATKS